MKHRRRVVWGYPPQKYQDDDTVHITCERCRHSFKVTVKEMRDPIMYRHKILCKDCVKKRNIELREIRREKRLERKDRMKRLDKNPVI